MKRILSILFLAMPALAAVDARLMRQPAVSSTHIAFVYAGDVWVSPKAGGVAQRLSTPPGEESFPRFSPDGVLIAFSGNYDGNEDIYVVSTGGGSLKRLTHHPLPDRMLGWYPDGKSILYASPMACGIPKLNQLFRIAPEGGLPERVPVPYGEFGAISPDGKILAFVPNTMDFRNWKRYRGGLASRIWLFDLFTQASNQVGDDGANYSQPMWHGSTLYFLTDRDARMRNNIWALDSRSGKMRQVTAFEDYDVKFPSMGPSEIVFENGGRLYLLDLASEKMREVRVEVLTDRATLRPQRKKVTDLIVRGTLSPTGKRVAFEARGDIFSVPAEHGPVLCITGTSGFAERYPSWSPDGDRIAYWSDRTGEYELTVRQADGSGDERTVTRLGPGFRYRIFWSPDSHWVAFADQAWNISLCDVDSGAVTKMDEGLFLYEGPLERFSMSWSADSRWIAYSRELPNRQRAVFLYDTLEKKLTKATSGFCNDFAPAFDPDGKYLYYASNRTFRASYGTDETWIFANTINLVAVPLKRGIPSPLAPRNDDETAGETMKTDAGEKAEKPASPESVEIDLAGFEERAVILPPKEGRYADLEALSGKLFYRRLPRTGSGDEKSPLAFYDLRDRAERTVAEDVDSYQIAAGGERILVAKKTDFSIIDPRPDQRTDHKLATSELETTVIPAAEWRQIFTDVWRFQRDFFYDPNLHGVEWEGMRTRYGALLDECVTRFDVNFVLGEMIAELNSSHAFGSGGDVEKSEKRGVGLLGADYLLENGAYRIKKIYHGAPWDVDVRSPLLEPGLNAREGDYLLAVNGVRVDTTQDPWAAFEGLAGKVVALTLNDKPSMEGARRVVVKTMESEGRLRTLAWVNENRLKVETATGGRVGYIYVPDTGRQGQGELYRQFMGQLGKDGLIIDERFNGGGDIPDRFVELLNRPVTNYWAVRGSKDWQWPVASIPGPKAMLINGWCGSGGDAFPLYFRMAGLGPLIGQRTLGGLIGTLGVPALVDGGNVQAPNLAIYSVDGEWIVEGRGVDPDIRVVDDPSKMVDGGDPQLDRGIEEIIRLLQEKPPMAPKRPAYENRAGRQPGASGSA